MSPSRPSQGKAHTSTGRLLVLAAAVLWSTSGLFMKAPAFDNWPGGVMAFWRALFAGLILLPWVRRPRWKLRLVPMVILFAVMNFTYLTALEKAEAAIAIWLQNTAPVWVFLGSALLFKETIKLLDWLLLVFAATGVGLILVNEARGQSLDGVIYGLLAGVTYGGVVLALRGLRDQDSSWLMALNFLTATLILSPIALTSDKWPAGQQWWYLFGFGVLQMGIPYVLFARGVQSITSHEASGIVLLEPVLVPLWVFVAWHRAADYQAPQWWTLCGGGLILAGLVIRYCGELRQSGTTSDPTTAPNEAT